MLDRCPRLRGSKGVIDDAMVVRCHHRMFDGILVEIYSLRYLLRSSQWRTGTSKEAVDLDTWSMG